MPPPRGAANAEGKEALCKYILRPPVAQDRVQLVDGDLVRLLLKRPFSDGTIAINMDASRPRSARHDL